jgi:NitT/TauT family transport system permease protein
VSVARKPGPLRQYLPPTLLCLAIAVGWEAASRTGLVPGYLLPAPSAVVARAFMLRDIFALNTAVTLIEVVVSFAIALAFSTLLALLITYVPVVERTIYPVLIATQSVPKVALAPLFVIWFGFGLAPKILVSVLVCFFPMLVNLVIGFRSIDPYSVALLRSMGAGNARIFWYLRLPATLPFLFGAIKISITLAVIGAITAEFIGANEGLGYLLIFANGMQDTQVLFASLIIISLMAMALYGVAAGLERALIGWHVSSRAGPAA